MLVYVIAVGGVEVAVVQIVDMIVVRDCRVATAIAVHVRMIVMDFVSTHGFTFILGRAGGAVKQATRAAGRRADPDEMHGGRAGSRPARQQPRRPGPLPHTRRDRWAARRRAGRKGSR